MRKYSRYFTICFTALMIGILTNLAHPVTPYLIKAREWPEYCFSIFFSLMSLGMMLFAPVWGNFGDKYGKRIVFMICAIGYSVGQVMFGLFSNIYLVFGARFFSGCFSCGLHVAIVSYLATSKGLKGFEKTRLIPMVLSFQLVGSSLGSFLGGYMGVWMGGSLDAYRNVLFIQAGTLSLFGVLIYLFFGFNDEELPEFEKRSNFFSNFKNVKKIGLWMILFLVCITFFSMVFTNAQRFLDYYYSDIGKSSGELGSLNLVIGAVTLVANILITPFLLKHLKPVWSCVMASIIGTVSLVITFAVESDYLVIMVYSVFLVYIISKAVIESASVAFISENKKIAPGLIMGVRQSFLSLGAVLGPLLGGALYYSLPISERTILFFVCAGVYFASGCVLFILYAARKSFKSNPEGGMEECESED